MAAAMVMVPIVVAACGSDDGSAAQTLPPIATTTTTTIAVTTTTVYVPVTYIIQSGDSLQAIAEKFGVVIEALALLNGITDRDDIEAGAVLDIPPPTPVVTTTP